MGGLSTGDACCNYTLVCRTGGYITIKGSEAKSQPFITSNNMRTIDSDSDQFSGVQPDMSMDGRTIRA
ncbi:MAG: hypothetical protein AAGD96_02445 [Chloroflexota bacterium]